MSRGGLSLGLGAVVAAALVALPWLNPFAYGPSPFMQPWLTSAACTLALWLLVLARGIPCRPRLLLPVAALLAWAVLAHQRVDPAVVMLAAGLLLVCTGAGLAQDAPTARALHAGWLVAAGVSALIGLAQYFGFSQVLMPLANFANAGEAFGNLRQPNLYATLCWLGVAVVLWQPLALRWPLRAALVALLAAASAASVSRTGMLQGLALSVLCLLWRGPQRRERLLLCGVAALAYYAAALGLPLLLEALTGAQPERTIWARMGAGEGCSSRLVLWSNVLTLIGQRPITGWGWGELDYAHFATLYDGPRFCDILDNAHNLPLHLAVELGIPAAVAVCGGALWWAWRQRPWREAQAPRQLAWAVLAILLLHSLLEYPLWYGPFQVALGAALGMLIASPQAVAAGRTRIAAATGAACMLLAAVAYAGWDYVRVSQIYRQPEDRIARWRDHALERAIRSWLFAGQARFAQLTLTSVSAANAATMEALAREMLHFSPEPRVIERAIESETLLGHTDQAVLDLARFRRAFPADYESWRAARKLPLPAQRAQP